MYFLRLLDIVSTDPNALVATLVPPLEGGGELVFADEPQDPLPGRLDRLLGQPAARQQLLHPKTGNSTLEPDPANRGDVQASGSCVRTATSALRRQCELAHYPSGTSSPAPPAEASSASNSSRKWRGYPQ